MFDSVWMEEKKWTEIDERQAKMRLTRQGSTESLKPLVQKYIVSVQRREAQAAYLRMRMGFAE